MGFMWEGSVGVRAVELLRELPQGAVVDTLELASRLDVKPGALHQLLANAVKLRMVVKVYIRGRQCVCWRLGPGGDSVTIERRKPKAPLDEAERALRRAAYDRRRRGLDARRAPAAESLAAEGLPAWLGGFAPLRDCDTAPARRACAPRPAAYLARWHVLYRDERGQVHGEVQVQAVHADLGVVDAWCQARGGLDRFVLAGFARIADADSGGPVDLQAWLARPPRASSRPLQERRQGTQAPRRRQRLSKLSAEALPA